MFSKTMFCRTMFCRSIFPYIHVLRSLEGLRVGLEGLKAIKHRWILGGFFRALWKASKACPRTLQVSNTLVKHGRVSHRISICPSVRGRDRASEEEPRGPGGWLGGWGWAKDVQSSGLVMVSNRPLRPERFVRVERFKKKISRKYKKIYGVSKSEH